MSKPLLNKNCSIVVEYHDEAPFDEHFATAFKIKAAPFAKGSFGAALGFAFPLASELALGFAFALAFATMKLPSLTLALALALAFAFAAVFTVFIAMMVVAGSLTVGRDCASIVGLGCFEPNAV